MEKYTNLQQEIRALAYKFRNDSRNRKFELKARDLIQPVSFWIKKDRMIDGVGYEFVIILRTCACSWARSEYGGCSMCGYFNDRGPEFITQDQIIQQVEFAFERKKDRFNEIEKEGNTICLKLFSSGSFFDDHEFSPDSRIKIAEIAKKFELISEIIFESRAEYIEVAKIKKLVDLLEGRKVIIAVGVESMNDIVRNVLINKGTSKEQILESIKSIHEAGAYIKAYLMLKPPFLNERNAIFDTVNSIKELEKFSVDIISINPGNIQAHTISDYLHKRKMYRTPWIYSLFITLQIAIDHNTLSKILIVCDPSAKGSERGIHNCKSKSCNNAWLSHLENFILSQDISLLKNESLPFDTCDCWREYNMYLDYSNY